LSGEIANSENPIRIAAALIRRDDGRVLLVRKRATDSFMQPGGKIEAASIRRRIAVARPVEPGAEIEDVLWLDPNAPGSVRLAPLTRDRLLPLCARPVGCSAPAKLKNNPMHSSDAVAEGCHVRSIKLLPCPANQPEAGQERGLCDGASCSTNDAG
jgi:hypothetical protein